MDSLETRTEDNEIRLPLYASIANELQFQIKRGDIKPGERLPTERNLSIELGVNRMTIRRAMQILEQLGLIIRRQGAGTYVAEPIIERQAAKLISFTKGMKSRGYEIDSRVVQFEEIKLGTSLSNELGNKAFDFVYQIHRLRLINHEPILLERLLIPVEYFPNFIKHDLSKRSLYEVMDSEYGVKVVQAKQSLEAVNASAYEAQLLEIELGASLMLEKRISEDEEARIVEYGKDLYRGDRFRFITEMAHLDI